jgi:hypothetical protein
MEMIDLATAASGLNVLILIALISVYAKNYIKIKTNFGLGLMLFAALLLLHNLAAVYFQVMMIMYYTSEVAGFAFILNVLEALGLAVLAYISLK